MRIAAVAVPFAAPRGGSAVPSASASRCSAADFSTCAFRFPAAEKALSAPVPKSDEAPGGRVAEHNMLQCMKPAFGRFFAEKAHEIAPVRAGTHVAKEASA
jgi:hypothetical protein